MQTAAIGMGVLGGAMSIAGGFAQSGAYKSQAAEYQQQARLAALQAKTDEANRLDQLNRATASNHAMYAAGNIAVESPTSMALDDANRDLASRSIGYMKLQSQIEQQRMLQAAASDEGAAKWSIMGGFMQAGQSIFQGVEGAKMIGGPNSIV